MKRILAIGLFFIFTLTACGPSQEELTLQTYEAATAIAASWTETPTLTPTATSTPTQTPTPTPTSTPEPSATPTPGVDYTAGNFQFLEQLIGQEGGFEKNDLGGSEDGTGPYILVIDTAAMQEEFPELSELILELEPQELIRAEDGSIYPVFIHDLRYNELPPSTIGWYGDHEELVRIFNCKSNYAGQEGIFPLPLYVFTITEEAYDIIMKYAMDKGSYLPFFPFPNDRDGIMTESYIHYSECEP